MIETVSSKPETPVAGAIVWVDLDGAKGTEQAGVRPAVVVSATIFNRVSRRWLICPITSNMTPYPTKVILPDGLAVQGAVLTDQVRSVDRSQRGFRIVGQVPPDILALIRARLSQVMETATP